MSHTVVAVFDSSAEAQTAVQQLVASGFDRDRIDVSSHSSSGTTGTGGTTSGYDSTDNNDSIGGFFSSLFGNDNERTNRYSSYARTGSIVTVHATTAMEAERAADLLDEYGAVDLDERSTGYHAGSAGTTMGTGTTTMGTGTTDTTTGLDTGITGSDTTTSDTSIPIIEEQLHVGKREVQTGGVRVRSRIIERPVEEHLRLREERVYVERNPVNRPASTTELNSFKEGEIELTEHAEVPMVDKEARVVEEVRVGKDVDERVEDIHETVRRTDVEVDNLSTDDPTRRRTDMDSDRQTDRRTDTDPDRPHVL